MKHHGSGGNQDAVNTIHMPFCGANREIIYSLAYELAE
jgi:hypothetical protein